MNEESRNQMLLRQLNEEINSAEQAYRKNTLTIVAIIVFIVGTMFALAWASFAHAKTIDFDITCPKDSAVCTGPRAEIEALIEHNNKVTAELKRQMGRKCNSLSDTVFPAHKRSELWISKSF